MGLWVARLREEHGIAVSSVIVLIAIGLGFSTAAAIAAVSALRGSTRDHDTKAALAAADAGADTALFRQNQVLTTDALPCVSEVESVGIVAVGLDVNANEGWCNPVTGTVGEASYEYEVAPPELTDAALGHKRRVSIVSTGSADGVTRRVKVNAVAPTGEAVFGDAGAIGVDSMTIGGASEVSLAAGATVGGAGSNGDVTLNDSGLLCGSATYGYGHSLVDAGGEQCPGFTNTEATINLGAPVLPDCETTGCDNSRIDNANQAGGDTSSPTNAFATGKISWNASVGRLSLSSNATLSLGGGNYVFCDLHLIGNSTLIVASPASTRIYIRDPRDPVCDISADPGHQAPPNPQFSISGNSSLSSTSNDPGAAAILMVGNDSVPTETGVALTGNSKQNEFTVYAPRSDIDITGNSTYFGTMAGKTLDIGGSAVLQIPSSAADFDAEVLVTYVRERFVECSAAVPAGGAPDAGC